MPAGVRRRALVLVLASAAALASAGIASAGSGGLLPPSGESPNAERISDLYLVVLVFAGIVFVLVEGLLVAFAVRYRRGRGPATEDAPQLETSGRTQLAFTVVPALVLAAIAVVVFVKLPGIADAPEADAAGETRIVVEGHQFYWLFRYPNGAVSVNRMVAPADAVVHLEVTAPRNDVNHSWWVPQLGGKIDAIPGHTNETWFRAKEGTYEARCAELCGIQHTVMTGEVEVVPREEYVRFLDNPVGGAALGKEQFEGVCLACHRLDEPFIGPALAGASALSDRTALAALVRKGIRTMPAVGSTWTDEQIDALYAYTKGLKASGRES
jgi:cytochrome c oxidase subunit II